MKKMIWTLPKCHDLLLAAGTKFSSLLSSHAIVGLGVVEGVGLPLGDSSASAREWNAE